MTELDLGHKNISLIFQAIITNDSDKFFVSASNETIFLKRLLQFPDSLMTNWGKGTVNMKVPCERPLRRFVFVVGCR